MKLEQILQTWLKSVKWVDSVVDGIIDMHMLLGCEVKLYRAISGETLEVAVNDHGSLIGLQFLVDRSKETTPDFDEIGYYHTEHIVMPGLPSTQVIARHISMQALLAGDYDYCDMDFVERVVARNRKQFDKLCKQHKLIAGESADCLPTTWFFENTEELDDSGIGRLEIWMSLDGFYTAPKYVYGTSCSLLGRCRDIIRPLGDHYPVRFKYLTESHAGFSISVDMSKAARINLLHYFMRQERPSYNVVAIIERKRYIGTYYVVVKYKNGSVKVTNWNFGSDSYSIRQIESGGEFDFVVDKLTQEVDQADDVVLYGGHTKEDLIKDLQVKQLVFNL